MIEPVVLKLIWVGTALVAYGLFRWRWLVATQEVVISAVQDAERWGRSPGASASAKDLVERFANVAYRPLATWCVALLVSVGVVVGVIRNLRRKGTAAPRTDAMDEEATMAFRLVVAVLMTSPIALALVAVVFCLGFLFQGSAKAVLGLVPEAAIFGPIHQPGT